MLKCELCGETIMKIDDNVFACEGCGCKYSKEQALKLIGKSSSVASDNDFVIVAGVLKEYKGSSVAVKIPCGVLEIGAGAFRDMTSLQSVILPDSVKIIKYSAFSGCTSLKEISLGNGLETICKEAFNSCICLQNVVLPESIKIIDENAFRGCEAITELVIPDSVEKIGEVKCITGSDFYESIFGETSGKYSDYNNGKVRYPNLTVRMPMRFDPRFVKGCKFLFDLSGNKLDTVEEQQQQHMIEVQRIRRANHECLACGGEIGFFSGKCKICGKVFGTL